MEHKLVDHLFRHHSGKMVSVLIRIFGLQHLDIIEDAVQDTFIKASLSWRKQQPEYPEAWLTKAAKNRVLDIFRTLKTQKKHYSTITTGTDAIAINELFLDTEIEDAQLRMIFTACHLQLDPRDRISFALKTVSGFSTKEIASALLAKEDTVKKRLMRARKAIKKSDIQFNIPKGKALPERLESVMEVLYLIFNEGFHSNNKEQLIREDLCGEAMRLCQLLLKRKDTRSPETYALFALMCFHSARLETKVGVNNEILGLKQQDRSLWHFPLIELGNNTMHKAVETESFSCYHYEAAIAAEHLRAKTFEDTNWNKILKWYEALDQLQPMSSHQLTMAVICLQKEDYDGAKDHLKKINPEDFEQRKYLYYATKADYYFNIKMLEKALTNIDIAIENVTNNLERDYLLKKKTKWLNNTSN
ncbi:RNA polymerase sigma factor [Winogradskyella immobilis]|uniref:Sigma-70 family RNA polymerase sigma factor n=1 Tax=Winogradskyella immobilis TaxID=2816852 RepID=A0ABS8EKF2_9FLAO|nr:sigma-70 family RNA polymerase sigma factor [Winogradskyella immobilis]MCC1483689.1 sigma-70 family RNA polymerase sigma factor [Winogradskyella immobilis]MCG0015783.1 sigma-70 family RNA polymerase sigma factor [Winogradskyella immobilis]